MLHNEKGHARGYTAAFPHPSNPFGDRRLLRNDERLRLSGVGEVGSAAELHGGGGPLLSTGILRLWFGQRCIQTYMRACVRAQPASQPVRQ